MSTGCAADDGSLGQGRVQSSIPRTDCPTPWLYPSPEQLHAAMSKKGHDVPQSMAEHILLMHNVVNEQCWQEICKWESKYSADARGGCSLKRFQGRPDALSPKAWIRSALLGSVRPFDRHDWVIQRADGTEVRYILDFYSGKPVSGVPVAIHLDVRPALDSFQALCDRLLHALHLQ